MTPKMAPGIHAARSGGITPFAADRPRELNHQEKDHRVARLTAMPYADRRAACSSQAARRTAR